MDVVGVEKTTSHFPLGQLAINYQSHGKMPKFKTQDFEVTDIENEDIPTACEMQLEALEDPENGLGLHLEYSSTLYGAKEMEMFFDNFLEYFTNVIKDHRAPISEVGMCGPKELENLKQNFWNMGTTANTWDNVFVTGKIMEQAKQNPHATAIEDSEGNILSYADLVSQSQRIAASLQQSGSTPGDIIGVLAKPGHEAIIAMLGTLIAGCGYLPMDPLFAAERLTFMASDASTHVLLVGEGLNEIGLSIAKNISFEPHLIPIEVAKACQEPLQASEIVPSDPFYVIYTSVSPTFQLIFDLTNTPL